MARTLHGRGRLKFCGSTSWHALPHMAALLNVPQQIAWDERHNHRVFWFEQCNILRQGDPLFLVKRTLQHGNIVTGCRDLEEILGAKESKLFSSIVWVQRPGIPKDPTVMFGPEDCDEVLHNDSDLTDFRESVLDWARRRGYLSEE